MHVRPRFGLVAIGIASVLSVLPAIAKPPEPSPIAVTAVFPSGEQVPANLLRLSLRFDRMPDVPVLPRLAWVIDTDTGRQFVERPFLESALWTPDGKQLTILLHPGRVKSGLLAHDQNPPLLPVGKRVSLTLDDRTLRSWTVVDPQQSALDVAQWRMGDVRPASRDPLKILLGVPIDVQSMAQIAVLDASGRVLSGSVSLSEAESVWLFRPTAVWRPGKYQIWIHPHLEDVAGNRIGNSFEQTHIPKSEVFKRCFEIPMRSAYMQDPAMGYCR